MTPAETETLTILTLLAILIGPILAVQIQKWIERYTEKRNRKINIFRTLIATRGTRLSFEHVRALNMIDTEFYCEIEITDAWKSYLDCLQQQIHGEAEEKTWISNRDNLFIDLLNKMAKSLGYHFDNVHLKKAIYIPKAHGEEEEYQYFIRNSIKNYFQGSKLYL